MGVRVNDICLESSGTQFHLLHLLHKTINSSNAISAAVRWLKDNRGAEAIELGAQIRSTQGLCVELKTGNSDLFFLKILRRTDGSTGAEAEYRALKDLQDAVRDVPRLCAPQALALFAQSDAYLMTHIDGSPLRTCVANGLLEPRELAALADQLALGLVNFYRTSGQPYADFHPENILLTQEGEVGFLDPTHVEQNLVVPTEWTTFGWPSSDAGYWVFSTVARSARRGYRELFARHGLTFLAAKLIESLAARLQLPISDFESDVASVAEWHRRHLARKGPKEKIISWTAKPWSHAIRKQIHT
jgi:hypothetical protein